eukprot:154180-Alexandrium_andersonii.AAC.1
MAPKKKTHTAETTENQKVRRAVAKFKDPTVIKKWQECRSHAAKAEFRAKFKATNSFDWLLTEKVHSENNTKRDRTRGQWKTESQVFIGEGFAKDNPCKKAKANALRIVEKCKAG